MIGLVHYHLRIGGVRRVMEAQAALLEKAGRPFRFIVGEEPVGDFPYPYQVIEGLCYGGNCPALDAQCPDITLWHFHNPTLGKNASLTDRIADLAMEGHRILMQLHDFAEDNRPENFARLTSPQRLYPTGPRIRYALINSRDQMLLRRAGASDSESFLLGNQVTAPKVQRAPNAEITIFYPVRGIRRKNLGEITLLAACAKRSGIDAKFAVALIADSPDQQGFHRGWERFAEHHDLPIQFNVVGRTPPAPGADASFEAWMAACTHVASTSIAEGFGMSFLEPGLLRIPLLGRDIPDITCDFGAGLDGSLYQQIEFALDAPFRTLIKDELTEKLADQFLSYQAPLPSSAISNLIDETETWDFGNLPEFLQETLIESYLKHEIELYPGNNTHRQPLEQWLNQALQHTPSEATPQAIHQKFGESAYQSRLFHLYDTLLATPSQKPDSLSEPHFLNHQAVLHQYLTPHRFNFLRLLS